LSTATDIGDNTESIGYGIVLYNKSTGSFTNGKALYNEYINKTINEDEAYQLLKDILIGKKGNTNYAQPVNQFMLDNKIQLEQHQFDALLDLAYNAGTGWLTLKNNDGTYYFNSLQMIKERIKSGSAFEGEWIGISNATLNGVYGRSENLVERRLDEVNMFLKKNYLKHDLTKTQLDKILDGYGLSHVTI